MTPMEGRGLLRGAFLLVTLSLVRLVSAGIHQPAPLTSGEGDQLPGLLAEAEETRESRSRRARPLEAGEILDPNRSEEEDLDRLPGVGAKVAGAIIRHRNETGVFRRPEDLLRVPGIGPATLARIRPHLDFSTGIPSGFRAPEPAQDRLDLNQATSEELQGLPGIGPALAGRIMESRARDGRFQEIEDLLRVSGIGPATLEKLRPLVKARR